MKLSSAMERYVLHWGEMGTRWGVNRSVAQVHALLYLAADPMAAEDIVETLGIARSNVSTSLKELQSWGLVSRAHVMGDRRDHFTAESDVWAMFSLVVEGRKQREIDPTLTMLRACAIEAREEDDTDATARARIEAMLEFVETLGIWYDQMRKLPPATLLRLVKLGARVARFVGK